MPYSIIKIQIEAIIRNKLEGFLTINIARKLKETEKLEIVETEATVWFSDIYSLTKCLQLQRLCKIISMLNEYFKIIVVSQ
jgi:hypothetical protein